MSYKLMFTLSALVDVVFGVGFMVVPTLALKQFGMDEYVSTKLILQFFGTGLLTVGLLAWFARNIADANLQKGMAWGFFVGTLAGLLFSIIGTATGAIRILGWLTIVLYGAFGFGYGFMLFLKPRMKE